MARIVHFQVNRWRILSDSDQHLHPRQCDCHRYWNYNSGGICTHYSLVHAYLKNSAWAPNRPSSGENVPVTCPVVLPQTTEQWYSHIHTMRRPVITVMTRPRAPRAGPSRSSRARCAVANRRVVDTGLERQLSHQVSNNHHRRQWTPADIDGRCVPGQTCRSPGSRHHDLASGRRGR